MYVPYNWYIYTVQPWSLLISPKQIWMSKMLLNSSLSCGIKRYKEDVHQGCNSLSLSLEQNFTIRKFLKGTSREDASWSKNLMVIYLSFSGTSQVCLLFTSEEQKQCWLMVSLVPHMLATFVMSQTETTRQKMAALTDVLFQLASMKFSWTRP